MMNEMKIIKEKTEQIFAYRTPVSVSRSIDEIKHNLEKHRCLWIGDLQNPYTREKFISFTIPTKIGDIPVRIDVPEIWYKQRYLERESYRALVLLVKSKLVQVELGEPLGVVFLPNVAAKYVQELLPEPKDVPLLRGGT